MFKKILSLATLIAMAAPAMADSPFHGTLTGGPVFSKYGSDALSTVTFYCDDPAMGHFDVCVDVVVRLKDPETSFKMSANLSPKLTVDNKNIALRYFVTYTGRADHSDGSTNVAAIGAGGVLDNQHVSLKSGQTATIYRTTSDGGNTWSKFSYSIH